MQNGEKADAAEEKANVEDVPPLPPPREEPQHLKRRLNVDEDVWEEGRKWIKLLVDKSLGTTMETTMQAMQESLDETQMETQIETQESQSQSDSVKKKKTFVVKKLMQGDMQGETGSCSSLS